MMTGSIYRLVLFLKVAFVVEQVTFEESKEADTATGQAKHFVARGLHDKVLVFYDYNSN